MTSPADKQRVYNSLIINEGNITDALRRAVNDMCELQDENMELKRLLDIERRKK